MNAEISHLNWRDLPRLSVSTKESLLLATVMAYSALRSSIPLRFSSPAKLAAYVRFASSYTRVLLHVGMLFLAVQAHATTYCVGNTTELRSAINAVSGAAGAGSNEIRVRTGIYDVSVGASGAYALNLTLNATPLSISGGWNAGCTERFMIGDSSFLLGNGTVRILSIIALANANAELSMDGLTFGNASTSSLDVASCLRIETDVNAGADINIDRVQLNNCRFNGGNGPALEVISRSGTVRVRSSLVLNNSSALGAVMLRSLGGNIHFNGNTVAHNEDAGAPGGPVGVQITQPTTGGSIWLSNNILWGNGGTGASDVFVGLNAAVFMNSNVVGVFAGDLEDVVEQNPLTGNPGFSTPNGAILTASSIARNSGAAAVVGGNTTLDFNGQPRIQGGRIDRGAIEFSEFLINGFE